MATATPPSPTAAHLLVSPAAGVDCRTKDRWGDTSELEDVWVDDATHDLDLGGYDTGV